ncbi:hypothetical protein C2E23DRAFT_448258 [Lenzites betulinus]|nr:hypothetical protein C2E23DRAFT_448258 [Lenzites betulinus]
MQCCGAGKCPKALLEPLQAFAPRSRGARGPGRLAMAYKRTCACAGQREPTLLALRSECCWQTASRDSVLPTEHHARRHRSATRCCSILQKLLLTFRPVSVHRHIDVRSSAALPLSVDPRPDRIARRPRSGGGCAYGDSIAGPRPQDATRRSGRRSWTGGCLTFVILRRLRPLRGPLDGHRACPSSISSKTRVPFLDHAGRSGRGCGRRAVRNMPVRTVSMPETGQKVRVPSRLDDDDDKFVLLKWHRSQPYLRRVSLWQMVMMIAASTYRSLYSWVPRGRAKMRNTSLTLISAQRLIARPSSRR